MSIENIEIDSIEIGKFNLFLAVSDIQEFFDIELSETKYLSYNPFNKKFYISIYSLTDAIEKINNDDFKNWIKTELSKGSKIEEHKKNRINN